VLEAVRKEPEDHAGASDAMLVRWQWLAGATDTGKSLRRCPFYLATYTVNLINISRGSSDRRELRKRGKQVVELTNLQVARHGYREEIGFRAEPRRSLRIHCLVDQAVESALSRYAVVSFGVVMQPLDYIINVRQLLGGFADQADALCSVMLGRPC
jgi:hypothetical protein